MDDRSDWDSLVAQLVPLIRKLVALSQHHSSVTIVAESFGGCLALRLALAVPELIDQMVLVNPATCFKQSYLGITGLVARTNLLSLFPERLYQVSCQLWTGRRAIGQFCGVVLAGGAPGAQRGGAGLLLQAGRKRTSSAAVMARRWMHQPAVSDLERLYQVTFSPNPARQGVWREMGAAVALKEAGSKAVQVLSCTGDKRCLSPAWECLLQVTFRDNGCDDAEAIGCWIWPASHATDCCLTT